jgi:hypothetical protein
VQSYAAQSAEDYYQVSLLNFAANVMPFKTQILLSDVFTF